MYIGETTDAPPTAKPADEAEEQERVQSQARRAADRRNEVEHGNHDQHRPPPEAVGRPAHGDRPDDVPISALATVNPSQKEPDRPSQWLVEWKTSFSASVVPEITAVSKPNSSPPRAATSVHPEQIPVEFHGLLPSPVRQQDTIISTSPSWPGGRMRWALVGRQKSGRSADFSLDRPAKFRTIPRL